MAHIQVSKADLIALAMASNKRVKKVAEGKRKYSMTDSDWNKVVQDRTMIEERPVMTKCRKDYTKGHKRIVRKLIEAKSAPEFEHCKAIKR